MMEVIVREDGWRVIWGDDSPPEWMAVDMDILRDVFH